MSDSTNPYKPDDKVFIKVKSAEVEATVRLVWKDELQVRVPAGGLLWRTVRTVRATTTPVVETPAAPVAEPEPIAQAADAHPANVGDAGTPHSEGATTPNEPSVKTEEKAENTGAVESAELAHSNANPIEQLACGVPEVEAERKRSKKNKGRR